jgi:hypothetical protein
MPELPQIQPEGGVGIPGTVATPAGTGGSQLRAFAQEAQSQAIDIAKEARAQQRYTSFHTADAEFITGTDNIFRATRGMQDPDIQYNTRVTQLGLLKDELVKKYPEAGSELGPQLAVRQSEARNRAEVQSAILMKENADDNMTAMHDSTIQAITAATPAQIPGIRQSYLDQLDLNVKRGWMPQAHANMLAAKFQGDFAWGLGNKLLSQSPADVMAMTPEQYGALGGRPQDLEILKWRANSAMSQQDSVAEKELKHIQDINARPILAQPPGTSDKATLFGLLQTNRITRGVYMYGTGETPENTAAIKGLTSIIHEHGSSMSPSQIDHWVAENVDNRFDLGAGGRGAILAEAAAQKADATTRFGNDKRGKISELKQRIKAQHPDAVGTYPVLSSQLARDTDIGTMTKEINSAKDDEELGKVYDKWIKQSRPHTTPKQNMDKLGKVLP